MARAWIILGALLGVVSQAGVAQQLDDSADPTVCASFGPNGPDPLATPEISRPPLLLNGPRAIAMVDSLSSVLSATSDGGMSVVWFLVDAAGQLRDVRIAQSSGSSQVDSAAVSVARQLRFRPAEYNGDPVCIWIARPLIFGSSGSPSAGQETHPT